MRFFRRFARSAGHRGEFGRYATTGMDVPIRAVKMPMRSVCMALRSADMDVHCRVARNGRLILRVGVARVGQRARRGEHQARSREGHAHQDARNVPDQHHSGFACLTQNPLIQRVCGKVKESS